MGENEYGMVWKKVKEGRNVWVCEGRKAEMEGGN